MKIDNRYEVLGQLGEGAMGTVYLVADAVRDHRRYALKMIKRGPLDSRYLSRFKQEFEIMTRLRHPNLARVYDFGMDRARTDLSSDSAGYYLTMEYINGLSLKQAVEREFVFQIGEIVEILVQLSRGLEFIHSKGILHRDIKPANIMLTGFPTELNVKVLDFGLSDLTTGEDIRQTKGTVPFLAPECLPLAGQLNPFWNCGRSLSTTTDFGSDLLHSEEFQCVDIYALGMTMFNLVSGSAFFENESPVHIRDIIKDEERFARYCQQSLCRVPSFELREIIGKMIAWKQSNRYHHATDIILDLNRHGRPMPIEGVESRMAYLLGAGFIGRELELTFLEKSLFDTPGPPVLTIVMGETGVGKTRLFSEFKHKCQLREVLFIEGTCVRDNPKPFAPIMELVNEALFYCSTPIVEAYGPHLKKAIPTHERLSSVPVFTSLPGHGERMFFIRKVADFLLAVTAHVGNVVYVIHDLHWADEGSLEIISALIETARIMAADRQDFRLYTCVRTEEIGNIEREFVRWRDAREIRIIALNPFTPQDVEQYFQNVFGPERLSENIIQAIPAIHGRIGGNPFFLQELIKSLVEREYLVRPSFFWDLNRPLDLISIPDTLTDIIADRLNRYPMTVEQRTMMQILSLLDRPFTVEKAALLTRGILVPVEEKQGVGPGQESIDHDIHQLLTVLEDWEIIINEESTDRSLYRFLHDLLRDVVRKSIAEPRILHAHIAHRLEEFSRHLNSETEVDDNSIDELAYHFHLADERDKAIEYLEKAANNANNLFATHKAITLYQQLMDILDGNRFPHKTVAILSRIGNLAALTCQWKTGEEAYRKAGEQARKIEDRKSLAHALRGLGELYYAANRYSQAMESLREARQLYESLSDSAGLAETLRFIGCVLWRLSAFDQAMVCATQSLELAQRVKDQRLIAWALKLKGDIHTHLHQFDEALRCLGTFLDMCQKSGDKAGMSSAWNNISVVYISLGKLNESLEANQRSLQMYRELGNLQGVSIGLCNRADIYRCRGDYIPALENIDRAIDLGRKISIIHHLSSYYIDKARLLYCLGRHSEALTINREGLEEAKKIERQEYVFLGSLFDIKIRVALAGDEAKTPPDTDTFEAGLKELLGLAINDEQNATVHFEIWKLTGSREAARMAYHYYQQMARITQRKEITDRLAELALAGVIHR